MPGGPIGIGIVGANVNYGWGTRAHLPALANLPEFELRAVCTNHLETAQETAQQFGIPLAFEGIDAMLEHPDIELVVVCVRVPAHHALVMSALEAGKHVFCEWPLGANLQQAIEMRDTARAKGVVHAVGLQSRGAPVLNQAHDLVQDGYVGDVVSVALRSTGAGAGVRTPASAWMADVANGANTLTIQGGHAIDAMRFCVGEFRDVAGVVATQLKQSTISGTAEVVTNTSPDNIAIGGTLQSGAVASVHVQSVPVMGAGFLLEIHGTEGSLVVRSESSANTGELELRGVRRGSTALEPIVLDEQYRWAPEVPSGPPLNVGQQYRRLAEAIRGAGEYEPSFDTAVDLHRLLDAMVAASATGERQHL
jgi:predicted dehydrogenase